ncbi:hypothetical protein [Antribacter gilvus]|uniref:hypothetical protein n=1 Tax=Antribacter gilvus TaxID=2304675 RepID=UPI0013DF985F|nr:hypothetical protein [Antribacter gilvus]
MYEGELEIHLTVDDFDADYLDGFAAARGIKVTRIELDRGDNPLQPMLTLTLRGSLSDAQARVEELRAELRAAQVQVRRAKIETTPWNADVPQTDDEASAGLYFEHHVKVRLPAGDLARRLELDRVARTHDARPSRNARRTDADGWEERFVTQRCFGVGRATSRPRLDALLASLQQAAFDVLEVEEEYVPVDDNLACDAGWFVGHGPVIGPTYAEQTDQRVRQMLSLEREGFPAGFVPIVEIEGVEQHAIFEPAHKQLPNAFKAGAPLFDDPERAVVWAARRTAARDHILDVVAACPWKTHLVARGSATLSAWVGEAAREPGDLDFVVTPRTIRAGLGGSHRDARRDRRGPRRESRPRAARG